MTTTITTLQKDLAFLCTLANSYDDPSQLATIAKLATEKQTQITALLSTAEKPPSQTLFSKLFSRTPTPVTPSGISPEEAQSIQTEVSTHIAQILAKC